MLIIRTLIFVIRILFFIMRTSLFYNKDVDDFNNCNKTYVEFEFEFIECLSLKS